MMITSGTDYHKHTSYDRHSLGGHSLDWANQPSLYKEYPGNLERKELPREFPQISETLSRIIVKPHPRDYPKAISFDKIARVFGLAYRLTSKSRHPGGEFLHRSVPSAGGLYPCELYMACASLPGLAEGIYHYSVASHALTRIREGNFLIYETCLTFFVTAIFFRSAWKYRDRSYRYHLLDTGHLVENLILTLKAMDLPFKADYDFDDQDMNRLLGLDPQKEVCLAIVNVPGQSSSRVEPLPDRFQNASRVSDKEVRYPALEEIHQQTARIKLPPQEAGIEYLESEPESETESHEPMGFYVSRKIRPPETEPAEMNYTETILNRRSRRNFVQTELPKAHYEQLLRSLLKTEGLAEPEQEDTVNIGFLSGNVEGLEPGCYQMNRSSMSVVMIQEGFMTEKMAHVCLGQEWLGNAALHFFIVANMHVMEDVWGPRGYRYAMMTAGRLGQRIYLESTALGLGCCGIGAFFDPEASELIKLNEYSKMLYLVAAGPVKSK